jgi:hypothetical protein
MHFIIYSVCGLGNDCDFGAEVRHHFRKIFLPQISAAEPI